MTVSCSRCGTEFTYESGGRRLTCDACRKPKAIELTFRERQIFQLIGQNALQNKEIAHVLKLSEGTVKEYIHRIMEKLGASNRTELAVKYQISKPAVIRVA